MSKMTNIGRIETFKEWKGRASGSIGKKFNYESIKYPGCSIFTKHGLDYLPLIFETIKKHGSKLFIELGTFQGGLSLALKEHFDDITIHTFDHKNFMNEQIRNLFDDDRVTFHQEKLLGVENEVLVHLLSFNYNIKKILYCDNGNKTFEIKTYAKYLNSGDLIGCHDWLAEVSPLAVYDALSPFIPFNEEVWFDSMLLSRFWIKK